MGFLGIFVIALDENMFSEPGLRQLAGIFLLLFSVISSGVGNIFISKYKNRGIDPVFLNSVQIFTGGLMLFAVSIPLEGLPRASSFPMEFYFAMGWLSFVSAAAFTIWFILLSKYRVKVSKLNFWKFIVPVAGVLFSWLFLPAEGANLKEGAGMLLVTISIILFSFSREKNVFQVKNC
jgi:drug/metabolite transporter (DMT)-like permease